MMKGDEFLTKFLIFIFVAVISVMAYYYWQGADSSIDWKVTTHAETSEFTPHEFQKGPFSFAITSNYYTLTEAFSAGPIERHLTRDILFLVLTWLGIGILLMLSTYLSRIWFTGVAGLFIFMVMNIELSAIRVFGFSEFSYWGSIIVVILIIAPAYIFQSYFKYVSFGIRIASFIVASLVIVFFSSVEVIALQEQFNVGIYFSIIVLMLLFLIMVAEENLFAILFLVTKNNGGENNEKHFSVFSLIYLVFLGMVYGKKAGFIRMELPFFDPYVLLIISSLVALWSLKYKREVYGNILDTNQALQIFAAIGIVVISYLALAFSRGNDPIFEGLHYFIIYAHLGFGFMFFLYTIINFVNPLTKGFQVHRIVYRERNFPYVTAKLAGIVIVTAAFLYSDQEAFKLFRAGHFNYLGEQAEQQNENALADQYFQEASIYGYDNHFSNYKTGYKNLQKSKTEEANYRFGRATYRYPTPQAYVNQSNTFGILNEVTPSTVSLQTGLSRFPENNMLLNNLGLIYTDLGNLSTAETYFKQANENSSWNNANSVNLWKIGRGEHPLESYENGNLAVKVNVIANGIANNQRLAINFDRSVLSESFPLHQSAFLINSLWYFNSDELRDLLNESIQNPQDESVYQNSVHAIAWSFYKNGDVNQSIRRLDQLSIQASQPEQSKYLNELGLIALEQYAPELALGFFERSIAKGGNQASLNKAVALLEAKKFDEALLWMEAMALQDSANQGMANDFKEILSGTELNENQRSLHLYYQWEDYNPAVLLPMISSLSADFIKQLWGKMSIELLEQKNYDLLEDYLSILKPSLDEQDYQNCLAVIALEKGLAFSSDHPVSLALSNPDSIRNQMLFVEAHKNALNVPLLLAIADFIAKEDIQLAYDLLVEAIDLNPYNRNLLKAYAMTALEMHLADYAAPIVNRLESILPEDEWLLFEQDFVNRKNELADTSVDW